MLYYKQKHQSVHAKCRSQASEQCNGPAECNPAAQTDIHSFMKDKNHQPIVSEVKQGNI